MKEPGQEPDYPGKVFDDPDLDYVEAVQAFVKASRPAFLAQESRLLRLKTRLTGIKSSNYA
jgi:hypothetical protein